MLTSESKLLLDEDFLFFLVIFELIKDNSFEYFANAREKRDGTILLGII
jgi:hypothetical protein